MDSGMRKSWRRKKSANKTPPPLDLTVKKSWLNSLPEELVLEVVVKLVSTSESPFSDLANLRTTCRSLLHASKDKVVGRSVAVAKRWWMDWWDKDTYLAFLQACEDAGNIEASYVLGMEELYSLRRTSSGLQHLEKAMVKGHTAAAYTMGVFLFRDSATRHTAIEILEDLAAKDVPGAVRHGALEKNTESGRTLIDRCRKKTLTTLTKVSIKRNHIIRRKQCTDETCGRILRMDEAERCWADGDEAPTNFCSSLCRWNSEYNSFVKRLWC